MGSNIYIQINKHLKTEHWSQSHAGMLQIQDQNNTCSLSKAEGELVGAIMRGGL